MAPTVDPQRRVTVRPASDAIYRRCLLRAGCAVLIVLASGAAAADSSCPAVGALRWDAWHGADGPVGRHVEKTLAPSQYQYRLPFCSRVLGPGKVEIECDSQEVMDREVDYAAAAGVNYWVFATQRADDPMSRSFNFYLSSARKSKIGFALRSRPKQMGQPGRYEEIRRFVQLMKDPSYQRVGNNRPLFFIGFIGKEIQQWGPPEAFREAVTALRAEAKRAGLENPYIAVMEFNPERAKQYADTFGFDAITTYATRAGQPGSPYARLAKGVEHYWDRSKKTGAQVIPIAMTGWDNRPKFDIPMRPGAGGGEIDRRSFHYEQGRPAEIGQHVANAIRWVKANPGATSAKTIIIYAWNEHDEGGWIQPTLSEGTKRVDALGKSVAQACSR